MQSLPIKLVVPTVCVARNGVVMSSYGFSVDP